MKAGAFWILEFVCFCINNRRLSKEAYICEYMYAYRYILSVTFQ